MEEQHTTARELRTFEALSPESKIREIWLNGRDTNGQVMQAIRDIEGVKVEGAKAFLRLAAVERNWTQAKAVVAFLVLFVAPVMFIVSDLVLRAFNVK